MITTCSWTEADNWCSCCSTHN